MYCKTAKMINNSINVYLILEAIKRMLDNTIMNECYCMVQFSLLQSSTTDEVVLKIDSRPASQSNELKQQYTRAHSSLVLKYTTGNDQKNCNKTVRHVFSDVT